MIALLVVLPATFGAGRRDPVRRFLEHPIPTWLGLISYGIFLWQFPVLIVALDAGVAGWWPSMQFPVVVARDPRGNDRLRRDQLLRARAPADALGHAARRNTAGPAEPTTSKKPATS